MAHGKIEWKISGVTPEEIEAFLAKPNHAVVGVNRTGGAPQLTVTWYIWDGKTFFFSTKKDRAKYLNLKRDPSISLLVNNFEEKWYVVAYGYAEIIEQNHDELVRPLLEKYLTAEEREQWERGDPDRVIVVLHPEKILTGH
ncbi:MAG: PPOX class F420-dependent oxidoreductase [Ktedonobacteraceae bacterium]|nr:PPOX class F420-dependent oxidoreductase [Ktedonobacteraceae bacterium]